MLQPALKGGEVGSEEGISAEQFVWLLGGLARFYRLPFDAALLLQQFPPPYAAHSLLEAARALGFKAGQSTIHEGKLAEVPLPAIGFLRAAVGPDDEAAPGRIPALILRCDRERFLYVAAGSEVPNARRLADFEALFEPAVVLVAHEAPADEQVREFEDEPRRFGFRWFVPALAKHKTIWRDVLLAPCRAACRSTRRCASARDPLLLPRTL